MKREAGVDFTCYDGVAVGEDVVEKLEKRVVEAAIQWRDGWHAPGQGVVDLMEAVDALLKARETR